MDKEPDFNPAEIIQKHYKTIGIDDISNVSGYKLETITKESDYWQLNLVDSKERAHCFGISFGRAANVPDQSSDIVDLLKAIDYHEGTIYEQAYFEGSLRFTSEIKKINENNPLYKISIDPDGPSLHSTSIVRDPNKYFSSHVQFHLIVEGTDGPRVITYVN